MEIAYRIEKKTTYVIVRSTSDGNGSGSVGPVAECDSSQQACTIALALADKEKATVHLHANLINEAG